MTVREMKNFLANLWRILRGGKCPRCKKFHMHYNDYQGWFKCDYCNFRIYWLSAIGMDNAGRKGRK